jgi:hypothetical protein
MTFKSFNVVHKNPTTNQSTAKTLKTLNTRHTHLSHGRHSQLQKHGLQLGDGDGARPVGVVLVEEGLQGHAVNLD